jgi:4-hydroxybenzoate polyprenyltransferase
MSMLAIQVAIGALNDRVDATRDAVAKPAKPIPAGLVSSGAALVLASVAGAVGLALSGWSGVATAAVAAAGLGLGIAYDLRLSRTPWSWLPLALALPLLPMHAWLGATGSVPSSLIGLVPTAVLAGTALAIANGLVDIDRDARTGRPAIAVAMGQGRAWLLHALLLLGVALLAVFVAPPVSMSLPGSAAATAGGGLVHLEGLRWLRTWGVLLGIGALVVGGLVLRAARPGIRERGWELEAVGIAGVGLGWLAGTAASTGGGGA